jgi:hypothetical protein
MAPDHDQLCLFDFVYVLLVLPTVMPAASLSSLASTDVLQLAVQLADSRVGLPASGIAWLLDWAETLDASAVRALSRDQLFDLLQLLEAATGDLGAGSSSQRRVTSSSSSSSAGRSSTGSSTEGIRGPSSQLIGLLCWAVADQVSSASALQVYCLVKALSSWRVFPPNGDVLLSAAAARVAEKMPMLDQAQLSDLLCGFARLGFTVGEPLQTKLCTRLLQGSSAAAAAAAGGSSSCSSSSKGLMGAGGNAAAQQQLDSTAAVLAAVLVSIKAPPAELVPTLMQQLEGRLQELPLQSLLQLGGAFAAAGVSVEGAAGAAAGGVHVRAKGSKGVTLDQELGMQYLAAIGRKLQRSSSSSSSSLTAQQLAYACSSLHSIGLMADEATAEAVVNQLQQHLGMDSSSSSSGAAGGIVWLVPVVAYIAESRFKPAQQGIDLIEQQLLAVLRSNGSTSSTPEVVLQAIPGSTDDAAPGSAAAAAYQAQDWSMQQLGQQQQQGRSQLLPQEFVQLLKALHDWGRRPGPDLSAAAHDWSRHQLVECQIGTLGPLLLWLSSVCGKVPSAWLVDWVAVSQQQLEGATAEDLATMAIALAIAGASASTCSAQWWEGFSAAVMQQLQGFTDDNLEVLCSSCYKLGYRPSQVWLDALVAEVQGRAPDSSLNTAAARALAWARQLKTA